MLGRGRARGPAFGAIQAGQSGTSRGRLPVFSIDGSHIGSKKIIIMAGPCAVESRDQLIQTALAVKKPGRPLSEEALSSPGPPRPASKASGEEGLKLLAQARDVAGLAVVTEVTTPEQVPLVAQYADVLQVGAAEYAEFSVAQRCGRSPQTSTSETRPHEHHRGVP